MVTEKAITGTLEYGTNSSINIGGLTAVMRGFKLYDWTSEPIISFDDNSDSKSLAAGTHTLTLKSLGNLDKLHANSELKSIRVALVSGSERNYASLITKRGYQTVAAQYLNSISPESPLAYLTIPNPLNSLVPTAHAWSWDGVWDGVKSTVGFLIPYEDFIIIGEQLVYLVNEDWKNFDSSKLAFASLGAATIIPIAKPLKPLLGPIKKMLDGMKRFPASKHFAGATGTAVKSALSGKMDKLTNLLPFILIAIELYEEPEVFEFIMNAIENEDDLWVWVDYIAEVVKVEGGLDELASYNGNFDKPNVQFAVNPLSFAVDSAYAKSTKGITDKLIPRIKELSKSFDLKDAKGVTKAVRVVMTDPKMIAIAAKGKSALKLFATVGGAKLVKFLNESKNWRVNRWLVLFSMVYLIEEYDGGDGNLDLTGESQLTSLINNLFSKNPSNSNGAVFQIVQTAYYHARHQASGGTMPKVIGIDSIRAAYVLINGERKGEPYPRQVDIILEHSDKIEEWVELKSYSKKTIQSSVRPSSKIFPNAKDKQVFREYFHDYRLNDEFITQILENKNKILKDTGYTGKTNQIFTWYYHDYTTPKGTKNKDPAPEEKQLKTMRKKLCNKPADFGVKSYQGNFGKARKDVNKQCLAAADKRIMLFNTRDYFTEVLKLVGNDFASDILNELSGIE